MTSSIQQASTIAYRNLDGRVEFCLISSIRKGNWIFPKGIIDPGETMVETALKESLEEAGLHGQIVGAPVGHYNYSKWGTTLDVTVMLMEVSRCDDEWDESELRERRWATAEDVRSLVSDKTLLKLFDLATARLAND